MTLKMKKYSIIATIVVATMLIGFSVSTSQAEVTRDVSVSSGSMYDTHKKAGLPYIEKTIVTSDLSMKNFNLVTIELTLKNAPTGSYVVLEPYMSEGGFVTDATLTKDEVFERAQLASEGQTVTGITSQKQLISFEKESILLTPNQLVEFDVTINLSDALIIQNPYALNFNIGFGQAEKVGIDKLPMKTGGIELRGSQYED